MGEPELVRDLEKIYNILPDGLIQALEKRAESKSPARFNIIYRGLEKYELYRFAVSHEIEFDRILQDLIACLHCDGTCQTEIGQKLGIGYYQTFGYPPIYRDKPYFVVCQCPGAIERKEQIKARWVAKQDVPAGEVGRKRNPREWFD